jgi:hypothetical protein
LNCLVNPIAVASVVQLWCGGKNPKSLVTI